MKTLLIILPTIGSILTFQVQAQVHQHTYTHGHDHEYQLKISFPDIPGYKTLVTDFHMHTVFSDGSVWPDVRIQEAQREGLDVVAFTEHLEYQPHSEDIPHPDRNRSYNIATEEAEGTGLMVVNGSEITRSMPPGHSNAVFINDANKLLVDDPMAAFEEANDQGAFIFWNHPHWTAHRKDGIARLDEMHIELIEKGLLHGIEVVNVETYSEEALQIALDYDLTIMGTSDIHGLTDWEFNIPHGGHRPVTLVFPILVSKHGVDQKPNKYFVKQALKEGATVVWYKDTFIGQDKFLLPLLNASIEAKTIGYKDDTSLLEIQLVNSTHSKFILNNESEYTFHGNPNLIILEPNSSKRLLIKTRKRKSSVAIPFKVMSAITAPKTHPILEIELTVPK